MIVTAPSNAAVANLAMKLVESGRFEFPNAGRVSQGAEGGDWTGGCEAETRKEGRGDEGTIKTDE